MQSLETLIEHLEKGRGIHVSILDLNGILSTPWTKISFRHMIHSKRFCDIAKSTARGYSSCLRCKGMANRKVIGEKKAFCGQCIYGLYEAVVPVVIEQVVMAVVYVGNAVIEKLSTAMHIKRTCRYTNAPEAELIGELEACEEVNSEKELLELGEIVADYLSMLYEKGKALADKEHWIVSLLKRYAIEDTCGSVSLKEFALSHQKNAQYIGRLFASEVGMSFSQYVNVVRLQKAANCIAMGKEKMIDVAMGCGFQNVSYFNRVFKEKYGVSPSEYKNILFKSKK